MHVTAIIAAAGAGRRLGAAKPKQLLDIGGGSMLQHSVKAFLMHPRVADVVVVVAPGLTTLALAGIDPSRAAALRVVKGGDRRQDSVANGFAAVAPESDVVLIHDAARPFVSADLIDRTIDAAVAHGAAIAALQSRDTVKRVAGDGRITETIPRETIYLAQTPQGFRRDVLELAHAQDVAGATDDAALVERLGRTVLTVPGDVEAFKVTRPLDLLVAEAVLRGR